MTWQTIADLLAAGFTLTAAILTYLTDRQQRTRKSGRRR